MRGREVYIVDMVKIYILRELNPKQWLVYKTDVQPSGKIVTGSVACSLI